jgi:uncharacterized protein
VQFESELETNSVRRIRSHCHHNGHGRQRALCIQRLAAAALEGFFQGWLWASLKRTGQNQHWVLVWSSLAFALWHLSAVLLETGFNPPLAQVPIFMVNASVLGAIWGMLRLISGSMLVASVGHGVWNGGAYVFFGFGAKVGALGIQETAIYGPEAGVLGLVLNFVFAAALWLWCKREATLEAA